MGNTHEPRRIRRGEQGAGCDQGRHIPGQRWRGRPVLSASLRLFIVLAPIGAAFGASVLCANGLPHADGGLELAINWIVTLLASTASLLGVDRAARRLLPLAVLLQLSLAFPKEAPSRFRIARRALNLRDLQARVETARREGVNTEPIQAASDMLALIAAVESHDRATRGHSERVRVLTDLVSEEMRLSPRDRDRLRWAALLHDVGKIAVPAKILNKPGKLTREEWEHIHRHPRVGSRLIAPLRAWLGEWAAAVEEHHERWDGKGYPQGLAGERISLGGRIVAVTDAYETMTGARSYRRPMSPAAAREELVACTGDQFDPHVVRAFLQISVKRLGLATGPLAWLAQVPVLMGLGSAVGAVGQSISGAAAAGAALAIAVAPVVAGPVGGQGNDGGSRRPLAAAASAQPGGSGGWVSPGGGPLLGAPPAPGTGGEEGPGGGDQGGDDGTGGPPERESEAPGAGGTSPEPQPTSTTPPSSGLPEVGMANSADDATGDVGEEVGEQAAEGAEQPVRLAPCETPVTDPLCEWLFGDGMVQL